MEQVVFLCVVLQPRRFWPRSPTAKQWTAGPLESSLTSCEYMSVLSLRAVHNHAPRSAEQRGSICYAPIGPHEEIMFIFTGRAVNA